MIDRRELLAKARERHLPLNMIEKDYVLGWVLFGLRETPGLAFKGGTALLKVYFPETWRLSEDLDFAAGPEGWDRLPERIAGGLKEAADRSGVELAVRSTHSNPGYLQLKVQYSGPLGRNWLKVDVTQDPPVAGVVSRPLLRSYSDYPQFRVKVERIEEIFAQKLRALAQRRKVRDYYDIWRMGQQEVDRAALARLFAVKLRAKGIGWSGSVDVFPPDLREVLSGYWEKELGRLVWPVPDMEEVLGQLRKSLAWLDGVRV